MPFKDSRQGPGTLLIGTAPGTEYGFQASAVKLVPSVDSTDGTPTLAVPEPPPLTTTSYSLDGTAINDYTDPAGLQRYCYDHDGEEQDFVWTPNTADAAVLTGRLTVRAFEMGGDVGVQVTTDFSWPCTGKPAWTGGAAALEADAQPAAAGKGGK
jgi:hypothetical protein